MPCKKICGMMTKICPQQKILWHDNLHPMKLLKWPQWQWVTLYSVVGAYSPPLPIPRLVVPGQNHGDALHLLL